MRLAMEQVMLDPQYHEPIKLNADGSTPAPPKRASQMTADEKKAATRNKLKERREKREAAERGEVIVDHSAQDRAEKEEREAKRKAACMVLLKPRPYTYKVDFMGVPVTPTPLHRYVIGTNVIGSLDAIVLGDQKFWACNPLSALPKKCVIQ